MLQGTRFSVFLDKKIENSKAKKLSFLNIATVKRTQVQKFFLKKAINLALDGPPRSFRFFK